MKFQLSDESVNSYGFRVLTDGIDLANFKRNPVMFYNHNRMNMPIGRWKNIKVENGKLFAEPDFDEDDELAQEVKRKVDKGYLNASSIGFDVLAISDDAKDMLKGQTRATVVKSSLIEASIVDIPSNKNSLKLYFPERNITLAGDFPTEYLNQILPNIEIDNMKELKAKYGLAEDATEEQLTAAIEAAQLQAVTKAVDDKVRELNDKGQSGAQGKKSAEAQEGGSKPGKSAMELLLNAAEAKGFDKDKIRQKAEKDFELTADLVNEAPAKSQNHDSGERFSDIIKELKGGSGGKDERANWTLSDWSKKDPQGLAKMLADDKPRYKKLFAAQHGFEPSDADIGIA